MTIFPAVRAQVPTARLSIVGRRPPEWLRRRVAATDFAELHADVADVRPYLATSGVMAVPLRIGGGSRLKILEALACGLPVVSTRIGAEGLRLENGRDLTVVERPEDMAAALVRLHPGAGRGAADGGTRADGWCGSATTGTCWRTAGSGVGKRGQPRQRSGAAARDCAPLRRRG